MVPIDGVADHVIYELRGDDAGWFTAYGDGGDTIMLLARHGPRHTRALQFSWVRVER
jgi:hypothetical protein